MDTTSLTLLAKLRMPGQDAAWGRFVDLYTPMLQIWVRRQRFQEADAADLVQNLLAKLLRKLPDYERGEGQTFRGWLFVVCRNECRDFLKQRRNRPLPGGDGLENLRAQEPGPDLDEIEYRRELVRRARELIRADFSPATWAAFTGVAVEARPAADVASELGMTENAVYMARHRVLARLRQEIDGFID